ncbi:MAG: tetratricopeptide repeat protein [Candidatus Omnitrophica bacterium]|nr:tetratricopeptide repeat protein [Candidatus Omnitrophota bacterium]
MSPDKKTLLISAILIIVLSLAIYANSLNCRFIWDDELLIEGSPRIKDWRNTPKIFTESMVEGSGLRGIYYRPLQMFTHMIDYYLWGLDARGYHLVSILFHAMVALSLYWLINVIFEDKLLSLFASILFLVHPIQTEAVTYISGRSDLLSALFMLLCFILYIKGLRSENIVRHLLMISCYILALLSKENSIILPLLFMIYHYVSKERFKIAVFTPIAGCAVIYLILRSNAALCSTPWINTIPERVPGFFAAVVTYIRLMILPFNLHVDYGGILFSFKDPIVITGFFITISLLSLSFIKRKKNRLVSFSILWFFIALIPVSGIYPLPFYMAEHFLYFPIIGFVLVMAGAITRLYRTKKFHLPALLFIIAISSIHSYLTLRQNSYWREPIAFYERTLRLSPESLMMRINLAGIYERKNDKKKAISLYKEIVELDRNHTATYYNIGRIYLGLENYREAIRFFKKAVEVNPDYARGYNGLGLAYAKRGDCEKAMPFFKKAIESNPYYAAAYNNAGSICLAIGENKEAMEFFNKAVEINPRYAAGYNSLGNLSLASGRNKEAIKFFSEAVKIKPGLAKAHTGLARAYYCDGEHEEALMHYDKAAELGCETNPELRSLLEPHRRE